MNVLANQNQNSNPGTRSDGIFSTYEYKKVKDGVWYFHIRLLNKNGWGGITHRRFQIDTKKPSDFSLTEVERDDMTEPSVSFLLSANDETSGISHFEIEIDGGEVVTWPADNDTYTTEPLPPGKHTLIAKAFDYAGNNLVNSVSFEVEPLPIPKITEYDAELESGKFLVVKGTSIADAEVILHIARDGITVGEQTGQSDADGNFTIAYGDKLDVGVYTVTVQTKDGRSALSLPSKAVTVAVQPSTFMAVGSRLLSIMTLVVSILALLVLIAIIIWYIWRRFLIFKKKLKYEVKQTERNVHHALESLRLDIQKHLKMLERYNTKNGLTAKERDIVKLLRKDLKEFSQDMEKYISKEIKDIPKDISKDK